MSREPISGVRRRLPSLAVLEITKKCNLGCKFCYAPWIDHPDRFLDEVSVDRWLKIIDYLVSGGVTHVDVTGGEPLMKDGVLVLLRRLKNDAAIKDVSIYSNLYLLSDDVLEVIDDPKFMVCTSFQGLKCLRELVGTDCDFRRWKRNCEKIVRSRARLSLNIVVCKRNLGELDVMLEASDAMGVSYVGVGPVLIEGRARSHPELWLTFDEIDRLYAKLDAVSRMMMTRLAIARERFCMCRSDCIKPYGTPRMFVQPGCNARVCNLVVGPDGHFRRCVHTWDVSSLPVDAYSVTL